MLAVLCALLIGCAGPSRKDYRRANFGSYPTNYHDRVLTWVDQNFDSPRSVYISAPVRARVPRRLLKENGKVYAWRAGVSLEEKGVFDQYTPRKHFHVYLRDADIVTASIKTHTFSRSEAIVQAAPPR